jgi:hypothetical protein
MSYGAAVSISGKMPGECKRFACRETFYNVEVPKAIFWVYSDVKSKFLIQFCKENCRCAVFSCAV